jgi:predicted DNA-binding protein YlxM (UPF0122 family)
MRTRKKKGCTYKLLHGGNDRQIIDMYISLTKMSSEEMHKALHYYFIDGFEIEMIATMTSVTKSNLHRDVAKVNEVHKVVEKIKEREYYRIRELNKRTQRKSVK